MRYVCLPAVTIVAVCGLVPSVVFGQGTPNLSITNYQYVSEQRISQASSYVTYRADLVNSGAARIAVTASVSSLVPSVVFGQGTPNLSITNYQYVSEQRISQASSY